MDPYYYRYIYQRTKLVFPTIKVNVLNFKSKKLKIIFLAEITPRAAQRTVKKQLSFQLSTNKINRSGKKLMEILKEHEQMFFKIAIKLTAANSYGLNFMKDACTNNFFLLIL